MEGGWVEVSTMPDPEGYRAAKEARADLARHAIEPSPRTLEATTTRMVNAAVYRYEHPEHGHHHEEPAPK
jgi:hypothetical protein